MFKALRSFLSTRYKLSRDELFGINTRYGTNPDGSKYKATTRTTFLNMRFHIFHKTGDKDFHTHTFEFWTFPLVGYREEILTLDSNGNIVPEMVDILPFRWTYKYPNIPHRVIGPIEKRDGKWELKTKPDAKIITILRRGRCNSNGFFYVGTPNGYVKLTHKEYVKSQYSDFALKGILKNKPVETTLFNYDLG